MDKLRDPDPILNLPFWQSVVATLLKEIEQKKVYHARQAAATQPLERVGDELPTPTEAQQYQRYQYHIETANLFFALGQTLSLLLEGAEDLHSWYLTLQHQSNLRINQRLQQLIIDHDRLYKEVLFWQQNYHQEIQLHTETTAIAYRLAKRLKALSNDRKI